MTTSEKKPDQLTPEERQVIVMKYKSKKLCEMHDGELSKWVKALLLKIHVITGWTIPANDLMKILLDQFQKKMMESYSDMNPDEIEFAFRNSGTVVEDWGKSMNLNLLDKVLIPYHASRFELSKIEEQIYAKPVQKIYEDWEIDSLNRKATEECFQRFRNGNTNYFPEILMKEILVKDGCMKQGKGVKDFFTELVKGGSTTIYGTP